MDTDGGLSCTGIYIKNDNMKTNFLSPFLFKVTLTSCLNFDTSSHYLIKMATLERLGPLVRQVC